MSGLKRSLFLVWGTLGRKMRNFGVAERALDHQFDGPRDQLQKIDVERIFDLPPSLKAAHGNAMRRSEWLERETMQRIRSSLYQDDRL